MCGITGFWAQGVTPQPMAAVVGRMSDALTHRGPDDSGVWVDEASGLALAHRRLSILDLSPAGHQPMTSTSGRFVIAFNGEIYNHLELRQQLEVGGSAPSWRGHADTETLLAAFEAWGVEATLQRSVGMFAFALWDRQTRALTLARDRLGEKPLYYGWCGGAFVFASELKAIRAFPQFDNAVERRALALFMRHNYVPAPWSIYENIWKLRPGCYLQLGSDVLKQSRDLGAPTPYWSARSAAVAGLGNRFPGDEEEARNELESLLSQSVAGQMVADVPLGAFLSGGIDSSTVVALMQTQSSRPVKTFTIGFHEGGYDEAKHASAVAQHLGTDHTEWYLTPQDALDVIPKLPAMYDEPFADSSQVPTHLVSILARRHVTVSLSGDAGDELFGGYTRYFLAARTWGRISRMPQLMRKVGGRVIEALSPSAWDRLYELLSVALPAHCKLRQPGDKLHKAAAVLASGDAGALYRQLVSHWQPSEVVEGADEPRTALSDAWLGLDNLTEQMMAWDLVSYLPDDILVKVDRAAMAVSLETRVPFLDHRVVEFAWRLPLSLKVRDGQGKWILRQMLYKYVPQDLVERPKMGFGVPIDTWLRGPLRDWAESLLDETRLRREGYFRPDAIRRKWAEHLTGRRNWQYHLWDVLMFQTWLDRWK